MGKIEKREKLIIILVAGAVTAIVTAGMNLPTDENWLRARADSYLRAKFGPEYQYLSLDFIDLDSLTVGYLYNITVGNFSQTQEVEVKFNSKGKVIKEEGVVDCSQNPEKCDYKITKEEAIEAAREAGLEEGTIGYGANIQYDEEEEEYVWDVRNLITQLENPPERGKGMHIDMRTGEPKKNFTFPGG